MGGRTISDSKPDCSQPLQQYIPYGKTPSLETGTLDGKPFPL